MSIITVSRGSYSRGLEVAEMVAKNLSYRCTSRDMLLEASKEFNIPEFKLVNAIEEPPTLLERISSKKERFITFIQYAVLREFKTDNVVYHGLAGHIFARGLKNVLKVRIIADWQDRIPLVMKRDGIGRDEAIRFLKKIDLNRRIWSQSLYGINPEEPENYDLVIHIQNLNTKDAADIICLTAKLERFQTTPESEKILEERIESYKRLVDSMK